jgi:hydroxymethylglutaryl-CoA lyase
MEQVFVTDVTLRDGLQNQAIQVATGAKITILEKLFVAGIRSVEATSFVSPKAVPQMADAADVVKAARAIAGLRVSVLVPNLKGLERAMAAGAEEVAVVLAATDTMNQRNINMSLTEATRVCEETLLAAQRAGLRTRAYVGVAFECPFEGAVDLATVVRLSERMAAAGAGEVVIADTIGAAAPGQVKEWLAALKGSISMGKLALHLHDTRGLGVANAWAGLEAGVRRFDSSTGGLGGCPFAPGAAGNLATEDLALMARKSGFDTGIDIDELVDAIDLMEGQLTRSLGGRCMPWLRARRARLAQHHAAQAA